MHYEFVRNSDGKVSDEFWIVRSSDYDSPTPNNEMNSENNTAKETENKNVIEEIKELIQHSLTSSIIVISISAIIKSKNRK